MIGRWKINIKGKPEEGGTLGYYTCSNCNMTFPATTLPFDQIGGDPNFCPNCGSDNREREQDYYTRAEAVMHNMSKLIDNYGDREEGVVWWEDEYGGDLTYGIDCHVVFQGEPPCLCDERDCWDDRYKKQEACAECKAIWLMGKCE